MRLAWILSVLLHLLIIVILFFIFKSSKVKPKVIPQRKISLDLTKFQTLPSRASKTISSKANRSSKVSKKVITKVKKVVKKRKKLKRLKRKSHKIVKNKYKKVPHKALKKRVRKKQIEKRHIIKKRVNRISKRVLHSKNITKQQYHPHTPKGPARRLIKRLYGSSYSHMSRVQQKFIDDNLLKILYISQKTLNYLGYPDEAANLAEEGTNIVQFYLHPNGDISGLKLLHKIGGSGSLDRQTIEVIKTAYMYYPYPPKTTKIIIFVKYQLY